MDTTTFDSYLADGLELDRVAVGPYCVYDRFQPSPQAYEHESTPPPMTAHRKSTMEDPTLTGFTFSANMRSPWVVSSGEDVSIVGQSPNDLAQEDWNEWMGWDAAQAQSPKALNMQVSMPPGHIPANSITSTPFTFSTPLETTQAFCFKGAPLVSSPLISASQSAAFATVQSNWNPMRPFENHGQTSPADYERHQQATSMAPPPMNTPSLQHSPSSVTNAHTSPSSTQSSPEPTNASNSKKRKSSEDDMLESPESGKLPPVKKTAHNMIEKRYRTNLNDKIAALRDSVPSLRVISRSVGGTGADEDDPEDLEGLTPAHKLNKATVLSKATEYIHHLEKRVKRLQEELTECKSRLETYNKLAISGPMRMPNTVTTPDNMPYQADPFSNATLQGPVSQASPQGLIPVPESLANLHRVAQSQQHYAYSQAGSGPPATYSIQNHGQPHQSAAVQQQMLNGRRIVGGSMMGKLMVGSLAGLMIMEGLSEPEKSDGEPNGRGLFSLPLSFLGRSDSLHAGSRLLSHEQTILPLARFLILLFAMLYLAVPFLSIPRGLKKKTSPTTIRLTPVPSLASPVEVRRAAWLTAIQTVWVPQHNFFLEAAALGLKSLKLSTRKLIGWHGYALLTGITREQEAARVKAWEIALDAQLTGGDAEISNNRLLLTLMASGTLPDTPARLMLKSLHVRILLWGYAKSGYGTWYMFEELSAKLARRYWNKAREEHRVMINSKDIPSEDRLPPHLAALVELDCDDVLIHSIIQRAFNVAWNKSNGQTTVTGDTLDSVVEDFAISSPLDALAAWWSSTILNRALLAFLSSGTHDQLSSELREGLNLAYDTAPPASGAQMRAIVAKAILINDERKQHIAAGVKALPMQTHTQLLTALVDQSVSRTPLVNILHNIPAVSDMKRALTISKCILLAQEVKTTGSREARSRLCSMLNYSDLPGYDLTLVSLVAAYRLLLEIFHDDVVLSETRVGLERFANCVRVWVGRDTGRKSGISNKARGPIVERCLSVSKRLVGMADLCDEVDAGYVSGSDGKEDS